MPLDLKKLENLVALGDGSAQARCPACAEQGQDKKGEHLRIYPDGRFGCCVFPGDREHRRRIFTLAGERGRRGIKVRVAVAKAEGPVQSGILGRLGKLFPSPSTRPTTTDATDGVGEVESSFVESRTLRTGETNSSGDDESRTPRTGLANSKRESALDDCLTPAENRNPRTLRTGFENPRVYAEKVPSLEGEREKYVRTHKGFCKGVRSVREGEGAEQPPEMGGKAGRMPHFRPDGTLVIPFDSPERFHWWKGGQSVAETRMELGIERKEQHGTGI